MSVLRAGSGPLVLFSAALVFASYDAWAQQAAPTPPAAPATPAGHPAPAAANQSLNVMVVDIQTLMRKSKAAVMVRQQLEPQPETLASNP